MNKSFQSIVKNNLALTILSGLLLFAAWPMSPFTFLIFFAFIPLIAITNANIKKGKYFLYIYLAMFIWNVTTTWWIWYASAPGAVGAILANSLLMTLPWLLFRYIKSKLTKTFAYIGLVSFWMFWEYLHLQDWGLSWPWLTVGNVFANSINFIQWYSVTGVAGGTLLVFIVNILLYELFFNKQLKKENKYKKIVFAIIIIFGAILFLFITSLYKKMPNNNKNNIVICQPNIDPYAKLETMPAEKQLEILLETSKQKIDSNTQLLIWPETALFSIYRYNENNLQNDIALQPLFKLLNQYPNLQIFTGIESIKTFSEPTKTSRPIPNTPQYYESYNSCVLLSSNKPPQFYHKSMLVPGVETLPSFLNFIGKWFEDFGGTTNGYTKNDTRTVLQTNNKIAIAPSICYESIYGGFMSKYIKNGANLIAIITNDGWWRNTPGHKQHFAYAKLRAIENNCFVARSANTGISGFITPKGEIVDFLDYNKNGSLKINLPLLQEQKTFYTKHPDLLYKIAVIISIFLMLLFNIKIWSNKIGKN